PRARGAAEPGARAAVERRFGVCSGRRRSWGAEACRPGAPAATEARGTEHSWTSADLPEGVEVDDGLVSDGHHEERPGTHRRRLPGYRGALGSDGGLSPDLSGCSRGEHIPPAEPGSAPRGGRGCSASDG